MPQAWPIAADALEDEAEVVAVREWADNDGGYPKLTQRPEVWAPPAVLPMVDGVVERSERSALEADTTRERANAMRVRLLATYIFRVEIDYRGQAGQLLVGGIGSRVFPQKVPARPPGLFRSITRVAKRTARALVTDERLGLDPAYSRGVRDGTCHVSDAHVLMPPVAAAVGARVELTDAGYLLHLPVTGANGRAHTLPAEVTIDADAAGELLVCTRIWLGPVHRDKLPAALALGHDMSFGRVAIGVHAGTGQDAFAVVDRRPYGTETVHSLYHVMQELARDAMRVIGERLLR